MAYTQNPHIPKVRGQAVELVRRGWSTRKVALHFGFSQSAVVKWCAKARIRGYGSIPTESSRPKKSPQSLAREVVAAIVRIRSGRRRCGQVIHQELIRQGISVSLSSVQRTLDRCHLLKKKSPWKRPHDFTPRPIPTFAGELLETDTIHIWLPDGTKIYIYTIIDLFSRWAYAEVTERISAGTSAQFILRARKVAPFAFKLIQTDNGSEFSIQFTHRLWNKNMLHRHARVRKKNDQAHIERFNRTIQEECLDRVVHSVPSFKKAIAKYLPYYNSERMHMGISFKTPVQMLV